MNTGGPNTQLIDGRFELLERLGGGGMGLVWRARDIVLHREVALKEVRPPDPALLDGDPKAARVMRERVLREARSLARLSNPHVVTIYHIVDLPEFPHPWLVMELVTGGSLYDRLARGPMSPAEAARLGRGVLSALSAAHAAGIQHRDVKPGNVLLRPDGTPVLTDFGIAALRESTSLTTTGGLIGSPEYIAPERIRGEEGNPASDLWSLGMMLYVAVEGRHPLRRATSIATLAAVLDEPIPPPVRSGPLGPVLSALLVRDTAARPDAEQLDRLLAAAEAGAEPTAETVRASMDTSMDTVRLNARTAVSHPTRIEDARPLEDLHPIQDAHPQTVRPHPVRSHSRRNAIRSSWLAAAVLAAAIGWTVNYRYSQDNPSNYQPATASPEHPGLITPAGAHTVIQALSPKMGGTQVVEFWLAADNAYGRAPVPGNPGLYDKFSYRDGKPSRDPNGGGTMSARDKAVDLNAVDWDKLPGLLQQAYTTLGIAHPTDEYVIVQYDTFNPGPAVLVYVKDAYGSAYLSADFQGNVKRTQARAQ
ncbi:serine/threonine protein kinase [Kitasatospora aureofaciens]|uniref:serine/threonine-protein kinase n=1 Tax=Kitasatospora aureofaciens TaxID=1894 RepID=UPI001C44684E|nr:serine/threonine-protein kinase [Kitasatospora aureofaciens]MBV6701810.1 serine/threonine protein kinase [Kitasatospora aureofaciens]